MLFPDVYTQDPGKATRLPRMTSRARWKRSIAGDHDGGIYDRWPQNVIWNEVDDHGSNACGLSILLEGLLIQSFACSNPLEIFVRDSQSFLPPRVKNRSGNASFSRAIGISIGG